MLDRSELASKYRILVHARLAFEKMQDLFPSTLFGGIAFVFLNRIDFSRCPNTICYGFKYVFVSPGLELLKEHREANVIKK